MDIKDLVYAKKVIVQIVWGERVIEFPTEVLEERGNGVLVKPYIYQDKPLELNITTTSGVVCNIFANQPDTDFYGCKVDNASNDYLIYGCLKRIAMTKKTEKE